MIRVDWQLKRCWVLGKRLHHGLAGAAMVAIGLALAVHDRKDWPWPINDDKKGAHDARREK